MFDWWDLAAGAGVLGLLLGAWLVAGWGGVVLAGGGALLAVAVVGAKSGSKRRALRKHETHSA